MIHNTLLKIRFTGLPGLLISPRTAALFSPECTRDPVQVVHSHWTLIGPPGIGIVYRIRIEYFRPELLGQSMVLLPHCPATNLKSGELPVPPYYPPWSGGCQACGALAEVWCPGLRVGDSRRR